MQIKACCCCCEINTSGSIRKLCLHTSSWHKKTKNTRAQSKLCCVLYLCIFHKCSQRWNKRNKHEHKHKSLYAYFVCFIGVNIRETEHKQTVVVTSPICARVFFVFLCKVGTCEHSFLMLVVISQSYTELLVLTWKSCLFSELFGPFFVLFYKYVSLLARGWNIF